MAEIIKNGEVIHTRYDLSNFEKLLQYYSPDTISNWIVQILFDYAASIKPQFVENFNEQAEWLSVLYAEIKNIKPVGEEGGAE